MVSKAWGGVPGGVLSVKSQGQKEACRSEKGMVGRQWESGLEAEVVQDLAFEGLWYRWGL